MKIINHTCQICGSDSIDPLYSNVMAPLNGLDMSYVLARCKECGFHFANQLPEESQYVRYYNELSKYDSQPSVSSLDNERIKVAVSLCLQVNLSKEARIVDLGCGFGALLAALRDAGYANLQGLDPAPQSRRQAHEQFGLGEIYQGTLADANAVINLREADLICLMAVLEHLPNLKRDLANLLSQLRPGARVLVEVPALDLFDGNHGEPFGELSIEHIQFFSAQSMRNLFACLGAHVIEEKLMPLSGLYSGTLFMIAEIQSISYLRIKGEKRVNMDKYLAGSTHRWIAALKHVPDHPFVLYGAGSHSARLLPQINEQQRANLVAVIDGNVNLHGKRFDKWIVESPYALSKYSGLPVLISSYRTEKTIVEHLKKRFPGLNLRLMYGNA